MSLTLAAGCVDMTPAEPCTLGGYAGRAGPWRRIADPLEAALAVFRAPDGGAAALLTLDTLYPGAAILAHARELAATQFGIGPDALLVAASHTHGAPMLDATKPGIGAADPAAIVAARAALSRLFADVAGAPATGITVAQAARPSATAVNRRLATWQPSLLRLLGRIDAVTNAPNPAGPVDPLLRVARFADADDRVVALLWNFACHPTDFPDGTAVTADFVGVVRAALRRRYGPVPVLFLQGFSGDIRFRWPVRRRWRDVRQTLVVGPHFPVLDLPGWNAWAGRLAEDALATFDAATPVNGPHISVRRRDVPLSRLVDGPLPQSDLTLQGLRVGPLRFVAASAEMLAIWGRQFDAGIIPVGCADDTFGYLPDALQARLGGYEGRRFFTAFGLGQRRFTDSLDAEVGAALSAIQGGL